MSIYIGSNRYKAMVGSSRADFVTKGKERLIYHWSGEDDLVNNAWIDRIQGFPLGKMNNPIHENNGYTCANNQGYFMSNSNTTIAGNGTVGLHIGRHWRVVVDCTPLIFRTNNMNLIIDFGSLGVAKKSFGFGISGAGGQDRIIDNYKSSNGSQTYSVATNRNSSNVAAPSINTRAVIEYGCEQSDNGDVQYFIYNGVKQVATQAHDPIYFEADFNLANIYVGNGNAGSYAIERVAIYDIKIYNSD